LTASTTTRRFLSTLAADGKPNSIGAFAALFSRSIFCRVLCRKLRRPSTACGKASRPPASFAWENAAGRNGSRRAALGSNSLAQHRREAHL
jgi:hypothetical protein